MAIKVSSTDVVNALRSINKGSIFSGFNPNDDNTARFVTVTPDGKAANEVSVTYNVDFAAAASEASDFREFTAAVGAIVPVVGRAVAAPGVGTVVNGLQVVAEQLDAAFTNPRSFETYELGFPVTPMPPGGARETYSVTLIVKAEALVTDTTPEFSGPDEDEFASLFAELNVSDRIVKDEKVHPKTAPRVEDVTISLPITGLTNEDPFDVSVRVRPQATTDGGAGTSVSLVKVDEVKVVIRAVPVAAPEGKSVPGTPPNGKNGSKGPVDLELPADSVYRVVLGDMLADRLLAAVHDTVRVRAGVS